MAASYRVVTSSITPLVQGNFSAIADVEWVSDSGATMPEKSTYFYPKLLTGLVMNPLGE